MDYPQGYSGSDILAKIYLNSIDQALRNEEFVHLRYVDDLRVFCRTSLQARRGLARITELLRLRGLNIHSTKTEILSRDRAVVDIDGVAPVIEQVTGELVEELQAQDFFGYGTVADLERAAEQNPDQPPTQVLERAFEQNFLAADGFTSTLFHYLLTRLAAVGSEIALGYCLHLLRTRPEETSYILAYLGHFELPAESHGAVFEYLSSDEAIYDYQAFLVLRHYLDHRWFPEVLIEFCRACLRNAMSPLSLRSYAVAIMGECGANADLEFLEEQYPAVPDELYRATLICGLARMERGRRNALLGHLRHDGDLQERAAQFVLNR